ncbi:MAG: hypothetical protein IJS53_03305, partial [Clostridia bacterium]|nr:hypothetical protein [Clostridia bacterium]
LCAEGDGEVHSCLYHISARGVVREALRLPGLPGALLPLPDGTALCGTLGALLHLRADGRVLRRWACGLPARLRFLGGGALCADPLAGKVFCVPLGPGRTRTLYSGGAPVDALFSG